MVFKMNEPKPDDRRDNESKIKRAMASTKSNIRATNEMIANTDNPEMINDLKSKNRRRGEAIIGMNTEMKQEAEYNKNHD
jgi:small acid-soluble spore protein (thioredoxin-like protein)